MGRARAWVIYEERRKESFLRTYFAFLMKLPQDQRYAQAVQLWTEWTR